MVMIRMSAVIGWPSFSRQSSLPLLSIDENYFYPVIYRSEWTNARMINCLELGRPSVIPFSWLLSIGAD